MAAAVGGHSLSLLAFGRWTDPGKLRRALDIQNYTKLCNSVMDAETPIALLRATVCANVGTPLAERQLLTPAQAQALSRSFKLLASDTRLRLLHALERAGELSVQALAKTIGMSPQAVSNQLQRLVDRQVLAARRDGNTIWYRIIDPCLPALLELGLCVTEQPRKKGRDI